MKGVRLPTHVCHQVRYITNKLFIKIVSRRASIHATVRHIIVIKYIIINTIYNNIDPVVIFTRVFRV